MKHKNKPNLKDLKKELVDIEKLKELGITKEPGKGDIEEVDGEDISGGRHNGADTTVGTQWPTGSGKE